MEVTKACLTNSRWNSQAHMLLLLQAHAAPSSSCCSCATLSNSCHSFALCVFGVSAPVSSCHSFTLMPFIQAHGAPWSLHYSFELMPLFQTHGINQSSCCPFKFILVLLLLQGHGALSNSCHSCYCFLHSHQQQLIIQMFRPPCSSPHQWNMQIAKHTTFKYIKKTYTGVQFKILAGNWRKLL